MTRIDYTKTPGVDDAVLTIGGTEFAIDTTTVTTGQGLVTITDGTNTAVDTPFNYTALGHLNFTKEVEVKLFVELLLTEPNIFDQNEFVDFTASNGSLTIGDTGVTISPNGATFSSLRRGATGLEFEAIKIDVIDGEVFTILEPKYCQLNGDGISPKASVVVAALKAANDAFITNPDALTPLYNVTTFTVSRAIDVTESLIFADISAAATMTLPPASSLTAGTYFRVKDVGGSWANNTLTITAASGNIDGNSSIELTKNYASYDFVSDGTNYYIL